MHDSVMDFARKILTAERVEGKRILEVGSFNVNGSVRDITLPLRPLEYVGVDRAAQAGYVDHVMDACDLMEKFGMSTWDVVISTETLEHVKDWHKAVRNMKGALRSGGLLLLTARGPGFPFHAHPADYWRFTTDDVAFMFFDFYTIYLSDDVPSHPGFLYAGIKAGRRLPAPAPAAVSRPVMRRVKRRKSPSAPRA